MSDEKPKFSETKFKDPELRRAQATVILQKRIQGVPVNQLAEEFHTTKATIQRRIDWAKREGLLESVRDRIFSELLPAAIEAMKMALEEGSVDAAKAVLYGTGALEKNPQKTIQTVELSLKEWRQKRTELDDTTTTIYPAAIADERFSLPTGLLQAARTFAQQTGSTDDLPADSLLRESDLEEESEEE